MKVLSFITWMNINSSSISTKFELDDSHYKTYLHNNYKSDLIGETGTGKFTYM